MSIFKLPMLLSAIFLSGIGSIVFLILAGVEDASRAEKVQLGESVLVCEIQGRGEIEIDPAKVTGFSEGRWYFVNGSATQCYTYERS